MRNEYLLTWAGSEICVWLKVMLRMGRGFMSRQSCRAHTLALGSFDATREEPYVLDGRAYIITIRSTLRVIAVKRGIFIRAWPLI